MGEEWVLPLFSPGMFGWETLLIVTTLQGLAVPRRQRQGWDTLLSVTQTRAYPHVSPLEAMARSSARQGTEQSPCRPFSLLQGW